MESQLFEVLGLDVVRPTDSANFQSVLLGQVQDQPGIAADSSTSCPERDSFRMFHLKQTGTEHIVDMTRRTSSGTNESGARLSRGEPRGAPVTSLAPAVPRSAAQGTLPGGYSQDREEAQVPD